MFFLRPIVELLAALLQCGLRIEGKLDALLALSRGAHLAIVLGAPTPLTTEENDMAKKMLVKSGPPVNMSDLQKTGATLALLDAAGNPVAKLDPATVSVTWGSSDPTILAVTVPDPANPLAASAASTGKLGSATITATLTFKTPQPPLPATLTATSPQINVTVSAPATADISLGPVV